LSAGAPPFSAGRVARPQIATFSMIGAGLIGFGVFLSGFVINEPAPYELFMVVLIAIWALFGLTISRAVMPLLVLLVVFNIGGMIAITQMSALGDAPLYIAVSLFLAFTSVFFAAVIEADQRRLGLISGAWLAGALATATLGILGYFGAIPGGEQFTLYDRARGAFQDPNVFGPYLVLPALMLMHGLLAGRLSTAPLRVLALFVLTFGIFLSFSRAAWGLYALSALLLVLVMLLERRSGLFRLRVLVLALIGLGLLVTALLVALQFDAVSNLFTVRAQLIQEYDGARFGRFERHKLGFLLAMERPLGIGPLVFGPIYGEDTHNIWLKALLDYGWIGFVSYLALMVWTFVLGFRYLLRERPWQPWLATSYIVLVGHTLIGTVIDTDHWRHFYLLLGILWGCFALEARWQRQARRQTVRRPAADDDARASAAPAASG
jgi:O-antigen ligase